MNGDKKMIMGLCWSLIKHYQIGDNAGRESLLNWINCMIEPMEVHDFNVSWNSGIALCRLVEAICPGAIPELKSMTTKTALSNCQIGISRG